ncbi:hypothetical protein FKM82_007962, partial [Ascaphus truei]
YQAGSQSQHAADSDDGSPTSITADTPSMEDFSLSLVDTNLPSDAEPDLRSFIAKRLTRGALFEGMGNVASVELSFPEYTLGCYYCLLQQDQLCEAATAEPDGHAPEYVVCFLGGSEKELDLYPFPSALFGMVPHGPSERQYFHILEQWFGIVFAVKQTFQLELDKYVESLKTKLDPQMSNLDSCIKPYLSSWFEDSVLPIHRVVNLFQEKLASLLYAALSYTPVDVRNSDDRTRNDINGFLSAASMQGLVQEGTMTSLCIAMTEEQQKSIIVDCSEAQPQLINSVSNKFCEDWMQVFINSYDGGNPFLFRQKLENFKLKAIQDMNNLKRLIRQAETSHYALFKCYMFLKNCGNGDILMKIVKVEHAEMPEASGVLQVLEEFIREEAAANHTP